MDLILPILVGLLAALGAASMQSGDLFRLLIGLVLLGQAANLLVFTAAGLGDGTPPVVQIGERLPGDGSGDPLAQALVLTAIVIGFGVLAFCLALLSLGRVGEDMSNRKGGRE
ncbi:MAG: NADH-quinone oxidoreductase subunit K [Verrucomicrobiales bacterium]|nr:NADH-quinone oxidoreductase subunit K [Verrucomicrobiales bacterium]